MANANDTIRLTFAHPRNSGDTFTADVGPDCTAGQALEGLVQGDEEGPFLTPGRPYELVSASGTNMTPNMTLREAGVQDGDVLPVRLALSGA